MSRHQAETRARRIFPLLFALIASGLFAGTYDSQNEPTVAAAPTTDSAAAAASATATATATVAENGAPAKPAPGRPYPALSIEAPGSSLVERYRAQYTTTEGLAYLSAVMRRSAPYRDFILAEIERLGLPECLVYLPVIESGFSATAVSRSGATGIWQFMRNSVSGYGIRVGEWMDERRDPWISTTAALRKLDDNYRDLGNWELALAAYNCGLGATRKAVKRAGSSDYWQLSAKGYFKRETVHYVPKFLAISEILSKSAEYGIDWGEPPDTGPYATIPVKRPIDLSVVSRETGINHELLRSINPALHYSITPPDATYAFRVPASMEERVRSVLEDPDKMLLEYYLYPVKSGDTLYALSLHYGVSVEMILQYNPGLRPNALKIGRKVVIPAIKKVAAYAGKRDRRDLDFSGSYLVKKGDTLWSIALAYGIQVETLAERNNLQVNSVLPLGKQLRVPIL